MPEADPEVGYAREREVHRLNKIFRSTFNAVNNHHQYLKDGFVPMTDALASMQRYKCKGYNPLPGDVVEILGADLMWDVGLITQSRNVHGLQKDDDISVETWLESVQEGWGSRFGARFRAAGGIEDVEDLKLMRPSADVLEAWLDPEAKLSLSGSIDGSPSLSHSSRLSFAGAIGEPASPSEVRTLFDTIQSLGSVNMDSDQQDEPEFKCDVITATSFKTGVSRGNEADELRCSTKAVRLIYGEGPRLWMENALLRAEHLMRMEKYHPDDFEEIEWKEWGMKQFGLWLEHADNKVFAEFHKGTTAGEQAALFDVVILPFEFFDRIKSWEFADGDVSCYTYLSVLGQGYMLPLFTLFIQFVVPSLLLIDTYAEYRDYLACEGQYNNEFKPPLFAPGRCEPVENDWYCPQRGSTVMKMMMFCAMLMYMIKVVPDNWYEFVKKIGDGDSDISRLQSLRRMVWELDEDTTLHKIGYRVDAFMCGIYLCLLYSANIAIIYFSNQVIDIILNALAIEFVSQLDELVVGSSWWDKDYRYLKAGAIEMVIRRYVKLQVRRVWLNFVVQT